MDKHYDESKLLALVEKALEFEQEAQLKFIESETSNKPEMRARALKMLANIQQDGDNELLTGQGLSALMDIAKPKRIGNYKIIDEIGRGGMGVVYRAERAEEDFEHQVAIKLVSLRRSSDKFNERLRSERRLLAQLKHPNIAQFYDGGETEQGMPFFVMELVLGKPLHYYVKHDDKSLTKRLDVFRQICVAISYAHANTIIHRDLSPSNILISEDNFAKVIDFGISSSFASERVSSDLGLTQTAGYTAPERLTGLVATTLGDVYSLGIILSDLLQDLTPKRKFELDAIILKATQENPEKRFQSVDALLHDLENYLNQREVTAVCGGTTYRLNCFINANRLAVAVSGVFIISVFVAAILFASLYFRAISAEASAVKRFNDVRSLANFMMFEHYDTVSSLPGSTKARAELAQTAQSYLDQLSEIKDAPFSLQIETAAGYRRLGDVYGNPMVPNLGRRAQAEQVLRESLQSLTTLYEENSEAPELVLALGDAHYSLSGFSLIVQDNMQKAYEHGKQAELLYRKYANAQTPSDSIIVKVSSSLRAQSNALVWARQGEEAIQAALAAKEYIESRIAERPENKILLTELSNALTTLGYNTTLHLDNIQVADYADAPATMERGISLAREIIVEQGRDRKSEALLALNLLRLGTVYYSMDQEAIAMTHLNEAKQIVEKLLVIDPNDKELRRRLNSILKQSSMTLAYLSNFEDAYRLSDQYFANQNLLIRSEPNNSGYQRELANGYGMRGEVAKLEGNINKACTWYSKADEQYKKVIAQFKIELSSTETERRFINEGLLGCM